VNISNLGQYGIIRDVEPWNLPPNAFSEGSNVRPYENGMEKCLGSIDAFRYTQSIKTVPYFIVPIVSGTSVFWVYAGVSDVYVTDGQQHWNLTKSGGYAMDTDIGWTGGVMGGVIYLNNGVDAPQQWVSPVATGTPLSDLSNWPSGYLCRSMRSFKQFMIAMDVTYSNGTRYPRLVKWSHGSSFNAVPSSWDETDATKDAGEYELAETSGAVLDGGPLRDVFIIYKEDAVWGVQYVGPPFIFRFYKITTQTGALNRRCWVETPVGHVVFGVNDCFVCDGQKAEPMLDQRARRDLYGSLSRISSSNYNKCFVARNTPRSEVWFCYPDGGATYPNRALIWNWKTNAIGYRSMPETTHIISTVAPTVSVGGDSPTWEGGNPWDENIGTWDGLTYDATQNIMVGAKQREGSVVHTIYTFDDPDTNTDLGANMTASLERTGLGGENIQQVKYCRGVGIDMRGTGSMNVYVGRQMAASEAVTWEGPFAFDPTTDHKIDCRVSGRLLGVKFESTTDVSWKLQGYNMDVVPAGKS